MSKSKVSSLDSFFPQYAKQANEITSPLTVVPVTVAVVVVLALCEIKFAGVVLSLAEHAQPVAAVAEFPIVIVTVHVPVVPLAKVPPVAPPTKVELEQPEAVNVVPAIMWALAFMAR